ncbi:hypothetical protein [Roseicyclus amphidinii]|uniref:hypothetical protein n=1 Tax=Roseicyclus amphidinii TaxID=3034232 RepID=UPI0024E084B4|nr:hypothetical protein [Roseicyclus sp. Amp-Y-6]
MKTDRHAWQALGMLAGFPALLLLAFAAIDAARGEATDPREAALVIAVGWVSIIPMALWQTRRPVVAHGVHAIRRRGRELAGFLALLLVLQRPPDDASLAQALSGWAIFGVIILLVFGVEAYRFWQRLRHRPSVWRKLIRGPVFWVGVIGITGFQLGHLWGATPAQALWLALVLLGVFVNFTFPWRFPRIGATPLGRKVLLLGEVLSMAAFAFVIDACLTMHGVARHSGFGHVLFYMIVAALALRFTLPSSARHDLR